MRIDIPDELGARLHRYSVVSNLSVPLLIERWAEYFEEKASRAEPPSAIRSAPDGARAFDPVRPPNLAHTRAHGTFDGAQFSKWNDLLRTAHIQAFAKVGSFDALKKITHAQILNGNHSNDRGYHFLPEIGISLQGVDSIHAWSYSLRLAQHLSVPLQATVEWRHNDKAAYPGQTGFLEWSPE
jgi:hypothetical protein